MYFASVFSFSKLTATPKLPCKVCVTMNLKSCVCKNKSISTENQQLSVEESNLHSSLEATPLADLPGKDSIKIRICIKYFMNNILFVPMY